MKVSLGASNLSLLLKRLQELLCFVLYTSYCSILHSKVYMDPHPSDNATMPARLKTCSAEQRRGRQRSKRAATLRKGLRKKRPSNSEYLSHIRCHHTTNKTKSHSGIFIVRLSNTAWLEPHAVWIYSCIEKINRNCRWCNFIGTGIFPAWSLVNALARPIQMASITVSLSGSVKQ